MLWAQLPDDWLKQARGFFHHVIDKALGRPSLGRRMPQTRLCPDPSCPPEVVTLMLLIGTVQIKLLQCQKVLVTVSSRLDPLHSAGDNR